MFTHPPVRDDADLGDKCSTILIVESKAVGIQVDTTNFFQLCYIFLIFHDKLLLNKIIKE